MQAGEQHNAFRYARGAKRSLTGAINLEDGAAFVKPSRTSPVPDPLAKHRDVKELSGFGRAEPAGVGTVARNCFRAYMSGRFFRRSQQNA